MKKHSFFVLIFSLLSLSSYGQNELKLVNSKKIDPNRYAGIDDSPYLFKKWLVGNVTTIKGEEVPEVFVNYNGYSQEFEIKKGDRFIELENKYYLQIEITRKKNGDALPENAGESMIFQRNIHSRFKDKFVRVLYRGKTISVIESFVASVSEVTMQDVGKTVEKKRFMGIRSHFVLEGGNLKSFSLKRSSIIKTFGYKRELDVFMRKGKIDVKNAADLAKVFAYYEELLETKPRK